VQTAVQPLSELLHGAFCLGAPLLISIMQSGRIAMPGIDADMLVCIEACADGVTDAAQLGATPLRKTPIARTKLTI
jgi:hypothetical protein